MESLHCSIFVYTKCHSKEVEISGFFQLFLFTFYLEDG